MNMNANSYAVFLLFGCNISTIIYKDFKLKNRIDKIVYTDVLLYASSFGENKHLAIIDTQII